MGSSTELFSPGGSAVSTLPMTGRNFSYGPDGDLVDTDGEYVYDYDQQLHKRFYFGASGNGNTPPPGQFAFYQQGGALRLADGDYLVTDATRGIELVSPQGVILGIAPESKVGTLTQQSPPARRPAVLRDRSAVLR
jgi:hypothetical protein